MSLPDPDPRSAADEPAIDEGVSSPDPAEGSDDSAAEQPGSPQG